MSSAGTATISAEHLSIVQAILHAHLPAGTKIFAFGSRAKGTSWKYSDLDLAIDAGRRLTPSESADLSEAFSESDLPWKVDIVDCYAITDRFRGLIQSEWVALDAG